jgi:DNA invertase Pin-like site-specific DNA recombinase
MGNIKIKDKYIYNCPILIICSLYRLLDIVLFVQITMSSRKTVNSGGLMKCWSYWKNSDTLIVIVTEFSRLSRSTAEVINHLALNNMSINENVGYHITLSARNFSITTGRSLRALH